MNGIQRHEEGLLRRLGGIVRTVDPPPDLVYELGRAAFETRLMDAELATLVEDTATATATAGVRSVASDVRLLSFEAAGTEIELQLVVGMDGMSLLGQVLRPPGSRPLTVQLEAAGGERRRTQTNADGFFELTRIDPGLFRLRFLGLGDGQVATSWIRP